MNPITRVFEDTEIRIIQTDGTPWFVAKDVCDALNHSNSRKATQRLDDDEKNTVTISDGTPGNPNKTVINEAGIYRLIFTSRKDEAERFKRWLAHDVLPSIRKTGRYDAKESRRAEPQKESAFAALAEQSRLMARQMEHMAEVERRVQRIEDEREESARRLHALPSPEADAPDVSDRRKLVDLVRAYAGASSLSFPESWGKLYRAINSRCNINVHVRAENRDIRKIEVLEKENLLPIAYAIAKDIFEHALPDRFLDEEDTATGGDTYPFGTPAL